jgi:S-adenosylmethionine:tRNA ribosyltransferase-isomerase
MHINEFDYDFPEELIAFRPTEERSSSRLLCLDGNSGKIGHGVFKDLLNLLTPNDLLVFNDTKVIPARLYGRKPTGGQVEILITQILDKNHAQALIRSNKPIKPPTKISFEKNITANVVEKNADLFTLQFTKTHSMDEILQTIGRMPLPPYINRVDEKEDYTRYQTIYAKHQGAIAAPTAGLHFDDALLTTLKQQGIQMAYVTLHIGIGTFQPLRVETIETHQMHEEKVEVSEETVKKIQATKARGGRIIAVGTTTVRSLETAAKSGNLIPFTGKTSIFIYPGFEFQVVDALITNLHLPRSTLLMLVCAFAGHETILNAYREAVQQRYRFFSYGDAMFITRRGNYSPSIRET